MLFKPHLHTSKAQRKTPQSCAGPTGALHHLIADLSAHEADNAISLEIRLVQHAGQMFGFSRMLDGALRLDWITCASDATTIPDDPVLIKRVNHALHGWQCIMMPTLVYVPGCDLINLPTLLVGIFHLVPGYGNKLMERAALELATQCCNYKGAQSACKLSSHTRNLRNRDPCTAACFSEQEWHKFAGAVPWTKPSRLLRLAIPARTARCMETCHQHFQLITALSTSMRMGHVGRVYRLNSF